MKNIYDVIRQKELMVEQLNKDLDALRQAARLLEEDDSSHNASSSNSNSRNSSTNGSMAGAGSGSQKRFP